MRFNELNYLGTRWKVGACLRSKRYKQNSFIIIGPGEYDDEINVKTSNGAIVSILIYYISNFYDIQ